MGVVEREAKQVRRWGAFQKTMLTVVACADVAITAVELSNLAILRKRIPGYTNRAKFNYQAKSALGRLVAKGCVVFIEKGDKRYARITEKGKRVLQMEKEQEKAAKKKKWDKRWRVVIFDIPERRRSIRVRLRRFMDEYGFVRLQDSVWIYPYDCEDLIALAKANFRIGADVLYMIVEKLEHDKHLREHFALPFM